MAAVNEKVKALLDECEKAAKRILEHAEDRGSFLIISHRDADGLSAAGILGTALLRVDASFRIRIERWMDEKVADEIASEKDFFIIMSDMGGGSLDIIKEKIKGKTLAILDHHQTASVHDESIVHVNPSLVGIDSALDISGAGTAYLTAKAISERNVDLAHLAVVGALGDLQDKYEGRKLGGVNSLIVEDAVKAGYLEVETDILLFGRETRPIHKALAYTSTPFIPGLSGEEDKCLAFLTQHGITLKKDEKWRALRDLSFEEKQKIFSSLSEYLASMGYKSEVAMSLLGAVYVLTREEAWTPLRDAREYALLLNATGRTGKAGLGVAICMGDRGKCLEEASAALEEYRQIITFCLKWLNANPDRIEEMENIYVVHGGQTIDEKVISAISTILSTNMPKIEKPLIAYSLVPEENLAKFSARTVEALTSRGFNLGEIMRIAAEKFSGNGGGHNIAAGAHVPIDRKDSFIKYVDELVKINLQRLKKDGS